MKAAFLTSLLLVLLGASVALAVPAGKSLTFDKGAPGVVTFDGALHNKAAKSCRECHNPEVFPQMKQGAVTIKMKEIYAGKQCGICHNGERAFSAKGNCQRCHKR
ncbi:c(7)-type cytochrome triheme domain-containing protein [Desulfuromonas thiophila]|jgi:c(7)-type cytochrome triheme protein|uniref:C(7)-type cytochrome triheme domain-containing protein n=1 Tax=Desulfuromonas thiophila TaxID=57664 RepID=A0A1G7E1E1_9BACT|nr:c(7)-type cytochrome triheme domain-containing protein [Desulfuromonas thiophila]MDD3802657.1 cytochrome c3 family protein [Desulfuromonas thiophila]MDY0398013.1 cytochrome c3 family protein [Desulfuromonas thiophila]SDE57504.1 c(7)-type cytochrome triheme domain-containing protein [Desulfuromonas thiophila]